jgi:Tfp pilus assembly protein PilF
MSERIEKLKSFLQDHPSDNFIQHALALEYIKEGKIAEARLLFEGILERSPDYVGSYYHLAKLLEAAGETALAMRWYERGMEAARLAGDTHAFNELQSAREDLDFE